MLRRLQDLVFMKKRHFESILLLIVSFFAAVFVSCNSGTESKEENIVNGKTIAICLAGVLTDMDYDYNTAEVKLYPKEFFEGCKQFAHFSNDQEETITLQLREDQLHEAYIGADVAFSFLNDDVSENPLPIMDWTVFQIPIQEIVERGSYK